MDIIAAAGLNNEALRLVSKGDLEGAEQKHLAALELKLQSAFKTQTGVALTQNGLGEIYLKMGKLDQAEDMLEKSYAARGCDKDFDASCTADNLGRLFEMKGDMNLAREWRTKNAPNRMICSYFECLKSRFNQFSKLSELKICSRCKGTYYCGTECQKMDWNRHKSFCKASAKPANN